MGARARTLIYLEKYKSNGRCTVRYYVSQREVFDRDVTLKCLMPISLIHRVSSEYGLTRFVKLI